MATKVKVTRKQARAILAATFPDYRGRTIEVEFTPTVTFHDTNWGGGSRNSYAALNKSGQVAQLYAPAPWVNPVEGKTIDLLETVLVVKHTIFCGHDLGITIYAHPNHLPTWLTA